MRTTLALSLLLAVACRKPQDADGDGVADGVDCTPTAAPTAEVCDGVDNDCNGAVDDGATGGPLWNADVDNDGYGDPAVTTSACIEPPGHTDNGEDCDDADPAAHPGAAEPGCDGTVDLNCDGVVGIVDDDDDGYSTCEDCDDDNNSTFPGAAELCNDRDDDCDGVVDNDADDADDYAIDVDADGHGSTVFLVAACEQPAGYVPLANADDCDDLDDRTYPGAPEDCDGVDNDCDDTIDDGAQGKGAYYVDADEDGFGDPDAQVLACVRPAGYVGNFDDCNDANTGINPAANETCSDLQDRNCDGAVGKDDNDSDGTVACDDCDDGRADVEPGAPELCDGVDNDCDTLTDESAPLWYADLDGDKHGNTQLLVVACEAPNGYVSTSDDCDDFAKTAFPGATETCDGIDTNCDSALMTGEADADGDGFLACDDDCDDAVPSRSPLGLELCNGADDDCDGSTDEAGAVDAQTWYADADGDKFGRSTLTASACTAPPGYVGNDRDCNDLTTASYPGNVESCDTVDNDCDGEIDEPSSTGTTTFYADGDGDGYGSPITTKACALPAGFSSKSGDCNDGDATRAPGVAEACNGVDDDCNGAVPATELDADKDSYRACADCDDTNAQIRPGNVEVCNGKDDNCDGTKDENAADAQLWYRDSDGDKFGLYTQTTRACTSAPAGYTQIPGDCNDSASKIYPGAEPVCDTKDNDCDGHIDFDVDDDGYAALWCGGKDCADTDPNLPDGSGNCTYKNCQDMYVAGTKTDGIYTIDPDGVGTGRAAASAFCLMSEGSGGWTQVLNVDTNDGNFVQYQNTTFWTDGSSMQGSAGAHYTSDYKTLEVFAGLTASDILIMAHREGALLAWRSWTLSSPRTAFQIFNLPLDTQITSSQVGSLNANTLDIYEAIVRPSGQLMANWEYGYSTSNDFARLINLAAPALSAPNNSDDACAGIGIVMNVSNGTNGSRWDAGYGWDGAGYQKAIIGSDEQLPDPWATTNSRAVDYDYAIFVR